MNNLGKKAVKTTGKKGLKVGRKILAKIIGLIGIPMLVGGLCLVVMISGLSSQVSKVSALSSIGLNDKRFPEANLEKGKATYVGVDDTDTEFSKKILAQTSKYSNSYNPYYYGYTNLCQKFCGDMYRKAGVPYQGTCCAFRHSTTAKKTGKIPKGALVYSGRKPDGSFYENNHVPGTYCTVCNSWAGHIGIYVGNGIIVGSQIPYAMSVDAWIEMCGYGGYSTY
ncbi:MAG: hypothetical protein SPI74_00585 [Eubacterium sp.]|nr:hypothetical protein [Eubacterium sp.]